MPDNLDGTACGFSLQLNHCMMFFTPPRLPSEFNVMIEQQIVPCLRQLFAMPEPLLCLRLITFYTYESDLTEELNNMVLTYQTWYQVIAMPARLSN
jgi:molybdopterin-biosynthesis enzyme MoeA-like protein